MQPLVNYEVELSRAGANVKGRFGTVAFLIRRYPLGALGVLVMALLIFIAVFANLIMPHDPLTTHPLLSLGAPSSEHWFGSDYLGRDVLSRIILGARTSIGVGVGATILGTLFGTAIGLASGFAGGKLDLVLQRLLEMLQAIPSLILTMTMAAVLGPSVMNTILAIAITKTPILGRVIRANTLVLRELTYVDAARAAGMSEWRIALRHILPNTLAPLIVLTAANLGSAILIEASLSFLGLGIPEPYPSWGKMLSSSAAEYIGTAPWLVIYPGLFISLAVFGSNLLGDALRDILDPRSRAH
ncbi:ABC transporter permease [Caballeronia mineralivorans PML1(12)]|uniref:ABC transporter permease n=1 Tax=Caballeronia mineralivorans PML1(12) TaxID=908627 RepID=A0A0J1G4R4_9BURK|nr:ABC transporter permease [Caballeronia mineralivorans]KLU27168.1 ABC transporter permease [Caballeronia mineralivorans PML1(12)]